MLVIDNRTEFEVAFEELTGESTYSIFQFARQELDPWAYFEELKAEIKPLNPPEEFLQTIDEWLENLDTANCERLGADRDDELEPDYNYMRPDSPRNVQRDIWGYDSPNFIAPRNNRSSRQEWKRTVGDSDALRVLCEYGNFDIGITSAASAAALRVRTRTYKGVPFLAVGAVQINMSTHQCMCGVYNCTWKRTIDWNQSSDKEYCEYVILSIMEHLGSHTRTVSVWPQFTEPAKRFRDSDSTKLKNRYDTLALMFTMKKA